MISEVNFALLETLRRDLADILPAESVVAEEPSEKESNAVFLTSTDFTVEELGIGGFGGAEKEEVVETLEATGATKEFKLSHKPLRPLISVESPPGSARSEPDDYTVNYEDGTISFRMAPLGEGGIQVRYNIARAVAEALHLKFTLGYEITIMALDHQDRNRITLEIIKALYRNRSELEKMGISDIRLVRGSSGYFADRDSTSRESAGRILSGDWKKKANILNYLVETILTVEKPIPAVERIEIKKR